ncbi:hypothetical protein E1301_Tti002463 [Triplophysa tibetana]|uniref:WxxW domain-containing protein n=1 Tax=Triplophysa tibetana TaxID=1572043 RepID=A0A5A9NAZ9_9TELE|nr:hypothetical protein E1301_Tti002463 [Triplophysa tibetana]
MIIKVFAACVVLVSGLLEGACSECTTQWFDLDDPNGEGDLELLSDLLKEYPGLICPDPIGIEVQTVSGRPASQTGNIFQVNDASRGFACVNADQRKMKCVDYRVRFTCPEKFCSQCSTQWFDRDDPRDGGDYELLSDLLNEYPGLICPDPIGIEVQTLSGQPASRTGNIFRVNDASRGFACVNADQRKIECVDYRVRFTCPEKFCSQCTTKWFDLDDPNGEGDYELLFKLLDKYPESICPDPIGIEVQTVSGQPAFQTGNIFEVYDPLQGFVCVNKQQKESSCCRTPWIDRDDPERVGDLETLNLIQMEYPLQVCPQPIAIEVTTLSGTQVQQTASIFQVGQYLSEWVTQWFDRDDDTGYGDYEYLSDLLKEYPGLLCPNPVGIEVQTISGQPAFQTGNVFQVYNPTTGFACVNANQGGEQCADYRVRFLCPETLWSSCSTKWFNRDDPSGKGDYELLYDLLNEYPGLICPDPIEIEAKTLSGQPASQTGNIFEVYHPLQGFVCVNKQQKESSCEDYMVRFTCPPKFCKKLASIS